MSEMMMVRLKPYDPTKKHLRKTWSVYGWKNGFQQGEWHRVTAAQAEYLSFTAKANNHRGAPCAFDICRPDEVKALIIREKMQRLGRTVDREKPRDIKAPPDGGSIAYDLNAGELEHELELVPDPAEVLLAPERKPRKAPAKKAAPKKTSRKRKPAKGK